jgi:hypothetical protein
MNSSEDDKFIINANSNNPIPNLDKFEFIKNAYGETDVTINNPEKILDGDLKNNTIDLLNDITVGS